ncbi:MAG TPA: hypothetical protein PK537_04550 [Candidatus Limiplasma sp.]|nr:hypothetical protein [Candidatus Limiplasma sp.]
MYRRLFVFLAVLFCVVCALLLLSALIITPEAEEALPQEQPVAHTITAFFSMPPTSTSESTVSTREWLRISALFAVTILMLPCLLCICDANGRVLCQKRYVRSFHLLFKQDLACG